MSQPATDTEKHSTWLICIALAVVTLLAYGRMVWNRHDFILYDDHAYVTMNREVQEGLTWGNLFRVFRFDSVVAANWHPVTVLRRTCSTAICSGCEGWGHHLTSLLWHTADTILLFGMRRMTGQMAAGAGGSVSSASVARRIGGLGLGTQGRAQRILLVPGRCLGSVG